MSEVRVTDIHPTAVVHPQAHLDPGVRVGPYAVVGADVVIGAGTVLGPHVVIEDGTRIGRDNEIATGAVIGAVPQDRNFRGERSFVRIGDRNRIREYANISRATGEGLATVVGSDCYLMAYVHLGHNCQIGDRVVIVNTSQLAGWVRVDDDAYVGGMSGIHQFCRVGRLAMVGGYSVVRQDAPPFTMVVGQPALVRGLNRVGLQRRGVSPDDVLVLRRALRLLYGGRRGLRAGVAALRAQLGDYPLVQELIAFVEQSQSGGRGIARWSRNGAPVVDEEGEPLPVDLP